MIELRDLNVRTGRNVSILEIDHLRIEPGEFTVVVGPSGAGKSTLLRLINGYVKPSEGSICVHGVDLWDSPKRERAEVQRGIGMIYQQFHLAPRLSVLRNVLCGRLGITSRWRSLLGWFSHTDRASAWSAICEVGLQAQVHQRTDTLSGGEQQRVAVARALAQLPSLILADEPVSSLDPAWAEDVLGLIAQIQSHHAATLVMSLHQPHWARRFAGRIIGLREGRVVFDGPPDILTDDLLRDLYRGDSVIRFDPAPSRRRPLEVEVV